MSNMDIIMNNIIVNDFIKLASFLFLFLILFLLSKGIKDLFTPYKINDQLIKKDNLAVSIIMCGYYLAVTLIFIGSFFGPSQGFQKDIILVGSYCFAGIILLNLSRFINDKIILRKFCNIDQIIKKQNISVACIQFGSYLATGIIAAAAVAGEGGSIVTFITFFLLGQISLFIFSLIYEFFTDYSIYDELEKNNIAAGIAFGGTLIALSIIVANGVFGNFTTWKDSLISLALVNIMAFTFLPIIRILMDRLVIRGDKISREIKEDKNVGAGFLEAVIAICFALILNVAI